MNVAQETIVVVLGAGCSCDYGYPLAKQTAEHLQKFGAEIGDRRPGNSQLFDCVKATRESFDQVRQTIPNVGTLTLDDFVRVVNEGRSRNHRADETVRNAKRAVAALFLHKERSAASTNLQGYHSLLRRMFPASLGSWPNRFRRTPFRVLTFNYDRLFEIAFRQYAVTDESQGYYGAGALNMGFRPDCRESLGIAPDRFTYLKLHGTVGVFATEDAAWMPEPSMPRIFHNREGAMPFSETLDDQLVCDSAGEGKHPVIVFPHEKPMLGEYPGNRTSFREYVPTIWTAAHAIMRNATSIEFVGYSCPDADRRGENSLESLLNAATTCRQIVVRDIDPDRVANRIREEFPHQDWRYELRKEKFRDT